MATAAKAVKPDIEIVGVQTQRYPSMYCAVRDEPAAFGPSTIAEGIAVGKPGKLTLPIVRRLVDDIVLVSEGALEKAIVLLLDVEKTVAEGAGAAGLAALIESSHRFAGKHVGLVLCGGNIDLLMLAEIIERGLSGPVNLHDLLWRFATCRAHSRKSLHALPARTPTSKKCIISANSRACRSVNGSRIRPADAQSRAWRGSHHCLARERVSRAS